MKCTGKLNPYKTVILMYNVNNTQCAGGLTMYSEIKTFTDKNGRRGKIGAFVRIYDFYNKKETDVILKVVKGHKQGSDGTILHFEEPPMPHVSMYHKTHRASDVIIVD